jgi:hypothetical protein
VKSRAYGKSRERGEIDNQLGVRWEIVNQLLNKSIVPRGS